MAKCEDCDTPIAWLRKPDGGWMPPTEPLFDFAYNDHFTATVEGIAQPVPQVYKRHECLTLEERQAKMRARDEERRRLIEEDRARRAEAERVRQELEEARQAQEEAERRLDLELERQERLQRRRAAAAQREREVARALSSAVNRFPERLLPHPCRDCEAEVGEPCRTEFWSTRVGPHVWWQPTGHGARYTDAPPDDRSNLRHEERWGPHYQGPWPPAANDPGRYEMRNWLLGNYLYVFTPEKVWLSDDEQENLTNWLTDFGGIFEEVSDGPGRMADQEGRLTGDGEVSGGHAGDHSRSEEVSHDRVDPF